MSKPRSPVLGYNHNLRHNGWMFHVQTEDSGIRSPHIFTHLFHEGVIIASKKLEYDHDADGSVVKGLMQAQHKSVMKELIGGAYDAKILAYLGTPPELEPQEELQAQQELQAVPLDIVLDERARTIPSPPPETDDSAGISSPYMQMVIGDLSAGTTLPAAGSSTQEPSSRLDQAASVSALPDLDLDSDDEDINGLLSRLRDETPIPELIDEEHAEAPFPAEDSRGTWLVSRPGQRERPFERSSQVPVVVPWEEASGPVVLPSAGSPAVVQPPVPPPSASSYSQHRRATGSTAPVPLSTPPSGPAPRRVSPSAQRPAVASARPSASSPIERPASSPPSRPFAPTRAATSPLPLPRAPAPPVLPRSQTVPPVSARPSAHTGSSPPSGPRSGSMAVPPVARPGTVPRPGPPSVTAPMRSHPVTVTPRRNNLSADSVVVARPAVVIGAPPQVIGVPAEHSGRHRHGRETTVPPQSQDSLFGQDLISEKSLDEVIMAYLSEDANDD